jgi:ribonuclease BN (tRNA processing enzyme)
VQFHVLGSAGSYPVKGRPASGYLLAAGDVRVWVDAGPGTFMPLLDVMDPGTLDAVVISHVHPDHCSDLFGYFHYMAYGPSGRVPVPVFLPEGAADRLAAFVGAEPEHPFRVVFDLITVGGGFSVALGDVTLRFAAADHSVPAVCVRAEADGRSWVYSGDTGPGGGLAALAAGASVLLCEATYQGHAGDRPTVHHLTAAMAAAIARDAGVGRLFLTHIGPTLDPAVSLAEAEAVLGRAVALAEPGDHHDV